MGNPQHIRTRIADLLKMDEHERQQINNMSMTVIIENLMTYTKRLEKGYSLKEKNKMGVSEFILKYKQAYLDHMEKQQPRPSKYEALIFSGKIIDRALYHYDLIEAETGTVTERNLIDAIQTDLEAWTPEELKKMYLV
jgi:hypothetical protein